MECFFYPIIGFLHLPRVQLSLAGGKAPGDGDSQSPTGGKGPGAFIYLFIIRIYVAIYTAAASNIYLHAGLCEDFNKFINFVKWLVSY